MAAEMGLSPDRVETNTFPPEKGLNGSGGRVGLMERLRGRAGQHRSWTDIMKTLRLTQINDKRIQSNMTDKASIQTCLDKLHRAMKITTQQSLIERLDLISRQLGMLFTPPTMADINQVVLSAEMFKVIVIWEGQTLKDVKVSHQDTPTGNFDEFISHLQGLLSIYSFNGDKKQKSKGYLALSNLEHDLNIIAQLQSSINGVTNYIHKSPLGILLPRRGGHPMKLIYYVSPYNLLCKKSKSSYPMTTLPDQQHAYYLNGSTEGVLGGYGCLVRKIPFTHPTMVPKVLSLLRQQLVFNSVLSSVVFFHSGYVSVDHQACSGGHSQTDPSHASPETRGQASFDLDSASNHRKDSSKSCEHEAMYFHNGHESTVIATKFSELTNAIKFAKPATISRDRFLVTWWAVESSSANAS
ncbi:MED1-like protein [Mya arenaria]|uniref:Mediator of RNA polymerase II transcription subunit 1 n=1 Tax=Mya arenaria TaxID=6604 RepID=A0ABY7D872_MYAAR|nr:MED1-like protein [Mya arenaria]